MFQPDVQNSTSSFYFSAVGGKSNRPPKLPYASAVKTLAKLIPALEVDFDHFGEIRSLSTSAKSGLYKGQVAPSPIRAACRLLATPIIRRALGLQHVNLRLCNRSRFGFGYRVDFKQVASLDEMNQLIPVRGGSVSVFFDTSGRAFSITSTLRRGRRPCKQGRIISQANAIAKACQLFDQPVDSSSCQLVYSSHKGRLDLAYEVILQSNEPRNIVSYLVLAKTGRIVDQQRKLWRNSDIRSPIGSAAKALLCTPDASQPISRQVSQTIIAGLPKPRVLRNEHFAMFIGHERRPVLSKRDGTYCYSVRDPEFAAVSVFIALNAQLKLYRELGMSAPRRILSVFVNDPTVEDNAYFDPLNYEIRIGIGSGLTRDGLNKRIVLDIGVSNHEYGHNAVFLQTPVHDLPGSEGAAMHEAIGDVLGTLLMDYLYRIWYARALGREFTIADLVADRRLIGKYALPPDGLRSQLNTKRAPNDMTGQPHNDGLIIGGAFADTLVGMALRPGAVLEEQLRLFAKINLTALSLVPMHKVSFRDMLRAFVTADQLETGGEYRETIEACFASHGIALGTHSQRLVRKPAA